MTETKKPAGRPPAKIEVQMLAKGNAEGTMLNKGDVVSIPREVAKKWQDAGVCKVVI
jgi:hypothetical protein